MCVCVCVCVCSFYLTICTTNGRITSSSWIAQLIYSPMPN